MKKETNANAVYVLLSVLLALILFNQYLIWNVASIPATGYTVEKTVQESAQQGISLQEAVDVVISKGIPPIYGNELSVNFDDPTGSLNVLASLDGDLYPDGLLKFSDLSEELQERYKRVGMSIACEFCCGAKTLIAGDGRPACGCAHSAAMRGLTKYLLIEHGNEYSDEQILNELTKWKSMFFPKQMINRYMENNGNLQASGLDLPDMVGGC
jgi:hypothetical protein